MPHPLAQVIVASAPAPATTPNSAPKAVAARPVVLRGAFGVRPRGGSEAARLLLGNAAPRLFEPLLEARCDLERRSFLRGALLGL